MLFENNQKFGYLIYIDKLLGRITKKKREDPNQQIYIWKRTYYNWYHRNTKHHKKVPGTTMCLQTRELWIKEKKL